MRRLILDHLPHDQQSDTDEALVRRMVAAQFPQWADLSVRSLAPGGWDNRTFRLGEHMVVRLPSASDYAAQVEKENLWLPRLARLLPLPIPVPLGDRRTGGWLPVEVVGLSLDRGRNRFWNA